MQPLRRGAVLHAFDQAAHEDLAAVGLCVLINGHVDRAREAAVNLDFFWRFQGPQTPRRQIARHAVDAKRVGAVGGDRDLDHRVDLGRIILGQPVGEALTHLARGQFDDAGVFVRQLQLALGGHHAEAFHTADFADVDGDIKTGDIGARLGQNHGDTFARIGGATDDLGLARVRLHLTNAQLVGVWVFLGVGHLGDGEVAQLLGRVHNLFDL